jgi:outer membrane porin, OprD family
MRKLGASHLIFGGLLLLATAPAALIFAAGNARSEEPGYLFGSEDAARDRFWSSPFIRDTTLELHPRTYYYVRDKFNGSINQAWAGGGWLAYESGLLGTIFHIGATLYTSQPIVAPNDQGGTLLLTNEQDAINTLGVAYLGAKFWGQDLIAGRQVVDTPLINRRDNRMIPITFEGATIRSDTGKDARFEYIAGYLQRFKPRDSNDFDDISQGFGVNEVDRGTPFGWFRWRPNANLSFAAENYWVEDIINTGYVEGIYKFPRRAVGPQFELAANLITQNSVGSDLLTGSSFFTYQGSARLTVDFGDLALLFVASTTGNENAINFPLGTKPNYTDLQQLSFDNAGEEAAGLGATLKLDKLGLKDVTATAFFVWGWDAINPTTNASLPNEQELDLALRWQPSDGRWKGLSVWARYADVFSTGTARDTQPEFRFIVDYTVPLWPR